MTHPTKQKTAGQRVPGHLGSLMAVILLGAVFWCTWNDSVHPVTLLSGAILTAFSVFITNRFLLKAAYQDVFHVGLIPLIRYLVVLIIAIFESGFHAIYITLTGRLAVHIVDLDTTIENPFHGVLIANAITLTPGTVTVEHQQGFFKVLWIECPTTDRKEAAELIMGKFERVLLPAAPREHAV